MTGSGTLGAIVKKKEPIECQCIADLQDLQKRTFEASCGEC